ncbi:hypothetical protein AYO40_06985 [Planctomycetaceae bacterium SCGC AG-212-D15]|nr:hypothetical protein AYO40_06985 [Planctomycetaceae bacterium SCGC AG-212-D15]
MHPGFLAILDEIRAMHVRKSADYGNEEDVFANIRAAERFGVPGWLGAVLRGNDKMARIQSFAANGNLANESLEDSLLDLANYAIIALAIMREDVCQQRHGSFCDKSAKRQEGGRKSCAQQTTTKRCPPTGRK